MTTNTNAVTISTPAAASKAAVARQIFQDAYAMSPVPKRDQILAVVQLEAGLSPAGAATYLQNFKRKEGMLRTQAVATA